MKKKTSLEERLLSLDIPYELLSQDELCAPEDFAEMDKHFRKRHNEQLLTEATEDDIACYFAMCVLEFRCGNIIFAYDFANLTYDITNVVHPELHARATYYFGLITALISCFDNTDKYSDELLSLIGTGQSPDEDARLMLQAARIISFNGKKEKAARLFERSYDKFMQGNDTQGKTAVLAELVSSCRLAEDTDMQIRWLNEMADMLHQAGELGKEKDVLFELGETIEDSGDIELALEKYLLSRSVAEDARDRIGVATADARIASLKFVTGDTKGSKRMMEDVISTLDECGETCLRATTHRNMAKTCSSEGDMKNASVHYAKAMALERKIGDDERLLLALTEVAVHHEMVADAKAALACYKELTDLCIAHNDKRAAGDILAHMADICKRTGDAKKATSLKKKRTRVLKGVYVPQGKGARTSGMSLQLEIARSRSNI